MWRPLANGLVKQQSESRDAMRKRGKNWKRCSVVSLSWEACLVQHAHLNIGFCALYYIGVPENLAPASLVGARLTL